MKPCTGFDVMELSARTKTPEGFLQAPATLARTGIQLYRARELGDAMEGTGIPPDKVLRLYRPPEEVFHPDSITSFDNRPVIMEPHRTVTAENWKELAVGDVHGVQRNGDLLSAEKIIIRDKKAIDAIESGKKFLSNGYQFDIELSSGVTATGDSYDGIQRNIRGNHVAIVSNPRGGSACRIADSDAVQGEKKMRKVTIKGVSVEVGDTEAGYIEQLNADLEAARKVEPSITLKVGDASKTITGGDAIVAEITARDAKIKELEAAALKPEQIEALVNVRVKTVGDASKLVEGFKPEGKTNVQIQREVIEAVSAKDSTAKAVADAILGGVKVGDADEKIVSMAFSAVVATGVKAADVKTATGADAAVSSALTSKTATGTDSAKPVGRAAFIERQNKAWMPKQ